MATESPDLVPPMTGRPQMRVLIVEDHTPTRMAVVQWFRFAGADAVGARDGVEAFDYLSAEPFDVMITDLKMPRMDGTELLDKCEQLPKPHRPRRIIVISGQFPASVLQARAGVSFMAKPLDLEALLNTLAGMPN